METESACLFLDWSMPASVAWVYLDMLNSRTKAMWGRALSLIEKGLKIQNFFWIEPWREKEHWFLLSVKLYDQKHFTCRFAGKDRGINYFV